MKSQLALECLPRSCLGNSSQEIEALIAGIPSLGVCFDSNHFLEEKPQDFVPRVGPRIVTVHIADYDGKDEKHWLPGKGVNDWVAITKALQNIGYRGPFLFECDGGVGDKIAVWNKIKAEVAGTGKAPSSF